MTPCIQTIFDQRDLIIRERAVTHVSEDTTGSVFERVDLLELGWGDFESDSDELV
jgi:hypothetical protein